MRRREFVAGWSAAAAWPLVARAQPQRIRRIGFLGAASPATWERNVAAFRNGLKDGGYTEKQNVVIEFEWGEGDNARLPGMAANLVRRQVDVIVTAGSTFGSLAAAS